MQYEVPCKFGSSFGDVLFKFAAKGFEALAKSAFALRVSAFNLTIHDKSSKPGPAGNGSFCL
eukprot:5560080-Amphidinium_carterae.1